MAKNRKRNVYYLISIPKHWYIYEVNKWMHEKDAQSVFNIAQMTTHLIVKTIKNAFKNSLPEDARIDRVISLKNREYIACSWVHKDNVFVGK